jgi:hypothetical protein
VHRGGAHTFGRHDPAAGEEEIGEHRERRVCCPLHLLSTVRKFFAKSVLFLSLAESSEACLGFQQRVRWEA